MGRLDAGPRAGLRPRPNVMRRPPRSPPPVIAGDEDRVLFVGLVMAIATLLTLDLKLRRPIAGSGSIVEARTAAFTVSPRPAVQLLQLALDHTSRSWACSPTRACSGDRAVARPPGGGVHLPWFNRRSGPSRCPRDWLLCIGSPARAVGGRAPQALAFRRSAGGLTERPRAGTPSAEAREQRSGQPQPRPRPRAPRSRSIRSSQGDRRPRIRAAPQKETRVLAESQPELECRLDRDPGRRATVHDSTSTRSVCDRRAVDEVVGWPTVLEPVTFGATSDALPLS